MKDLMRIKSLLSVEIEAILNLQVKKEAHSSALYLAMASWCDRNGFDGSANHFFKQSDEERQHQLKLFKYILDMGGNALSPDISNIKTEFNSFREVFEDALEQEIAITQSFKNIINKCLKEQDHVTIEFLNWFLKEQREEEYVARRILELFEVIGDAGTAHWEIDKQVAKVHYTAD